MSKNEIVLEDKNNYIIFTTNKENVFESDNENVIYADNDIREVIPKGYLLSQINLSTIPDIIKDAIDAAILDAKTQTLSDALIENLRNSIDNLNDGIYKKTYIDNTITYLEELLIQKASPEVVAAIAEAKIAVATADFATASHVQLLTSRVNDSESEIIEVKETINTNEVARAIKELEMEARIEDTFAGYSEAIDLYVDEDGTVRAGKFEELKIKVQGDYEALLDSVTTLQNQNDGVVETVSGTHAVVDVNKNILTTAEPYATWLATDTVNNNSLERANHIGDTYILTTTASDGSSEYAGAYRFIKIEPNLTSPNKTDADGFTWSKIVDTGVEEALAKATQAIGLANGKVSTYYGTNANKNNMSNGWTAQQKIDNIGDIYYASDNNNKPYRWSGTGWVLIDDKKVGTLEVSLASTDSLVSTVSGWAANASKLITDTAGNITGWAFGNGSNTKSFFTIMADVFKIKTTTTSKSPFSISGDDIIFNGKVSFTNTTGGQDAINAAKAVSLLAASNAQTSANTANTLLSDIASDSKLTAKEKISTKKEWDIIVSEKTKNTAQATTYGVSTTAYNNAYNSLNTYITPLLSNLTTTSNIVGTTFRSNFKTYYDARTDLLNAIATKINANITENIEAINIANPSYSIFDGSSLPSLFVPNGRLERRTDSAWIKFGGAGLMLWADAPNAQVYLGKTSSDYNISIPKDSNIVVSAWVKANRAEAAAQLHIRTNDGVHDGSSYDIGTNVWTRIAKSFNSGSNTKMIIRLDCEGYSGASIAMAIDGVMVEVSNTGIPSAFKSPTLNNISWQQEVQNAINNNATTIDGGKIVTNQAFVNKLNAVGGIIADNVNADTFVGKTFIGGVFNGARINGAIIKASYLDLDGDLEVLTNFIISVATRNANPSLYTDAVYISADNQYRIPTISAIQEPTTALQNVNFGGFIQGTMRPYNVANAGHNLKAVKIKPRFSNTKNIVMEAYAPAIGGGWGLQTVAQVRLNNTVVFEVEIRDVNVDGSRTIGTAIIRNKITNQSQTGTYIQRGDGSRYDNLLLYNVPILGTVKAIVETQFGYDSSGYTKVQIEVDNALLNSDLPFNWNANEGIRIYFTNRGVSQPENHWVKGRFNGIGINNMI